MTVDDRGEGGCLAYLVSPDDVISGQPLIMTVIVIACKNSDCSRETLFLCFVPFHSSVACTAL